MYKSVPTYNSKTNKWTETKFETREDFKKYIRSKCLPPGEFKLCNTWAFNQEGTKFKEKGHYCTAPFNSQDFRKYWETEKRKCREGIIVDDFYITRYYYFWLNFLPINDKEINKLIFPRIWDAQYYFFIYIELCQLEYKYSSVVKKRQFGSSFQHLAILINDIWFEESYVNKIGAAEEPFVLSDWAMLEDYRNFLNDHTAWYRQFTPDKTLNWQQRFEVRETNRKTFRGNMSQLKGLNLKLNATKSVGGKCNKFYYEEAGISKTLRRTFNYIDPALKLGAITTGLFMSAGSVGELDDCEDLKKMAFNPEGFNILPVKNTFNPSSEHREICFFVPEYWSMPPFIDGQGNSMIEDAKQWCEEERERKKAVQSPEDYRLYTSQHPFTLEEAFAWRKASIFNQELIITQQERIIVNNNKPLIVELTKGQNGQITHTLCDNCVPIETFPLSEKSGKEGAVQLWEAPELNPKFFTYFAGVDPILVDKTSSSTSLFSIYIVKNLVEEIYDDDGQKKIKLDGYKIVASYTGRYDDVTKTNETAEMLIVWYNALTAVENNVMSFINHMQSKGLQRYLATKDQLSFVSELKTNKNVYCPYGFKMNNIIWNYFIDIINEYTTEEIDVLKHKNTGEVLRTIHGVERIKDMLLLEEMRQFHDKLNVDRLVSFGAALSLMKSFSKYNIGTITIDKTDENNKTPKPLAVTKSFFRKYHDHLIKDQEDQYKTRRGYFKNYS